MPVNSILPVRRLPEAFSEPGGYLDVGVCPGASARFDYSGVLEESASPRRGGPRQTENAQGQGVLQRPGLQAEIRQPKKARMARALLIPSAGPPTVVPLFTNLVEGRSSRKFGCMILTLLYGGGSTLQPNMDIVEDRRLRIGELAKQTGLSIKTIRYYESRGLLEQPPRTEGGYRLYGPEEVAQLRFVQRAKLLGLTLEEIRELVVLADRCNEGEIVPRLEEVLRGKLEETERKMAELAAFRQNLLYYRERAEALKGRVPTDLYCEDVSFCGCLEAVTGEGGEKL